MQKISSEPDPKRNMIDYEIVATTEGPEDDGLICPLMKVTPY